MTLALVAVGLGVVAVALVDIAWTTIAAGSGAGPLTRRLGRWTWSAALALHRRRPSHRLLAVAGVGVVVVILATWIAAVLVGWSLVFLASDGVVRSTSGATASIVERLYFTGYTVFTLGNGDFRPVGGTWQLASVAATGTGLVLVTLSITYLVPVASAVAQRRQLATYIFALGDGPADIVARTWDGSGFGSLSQHLVALAPLIDGTAQHHLAYPVLHYYHSVEPASAVPPRLVDLALAVEAMAHGVAPAARPDPASLGPVERAIDSFLDTLAAAYISSTEDPLPPLRLDRLRRQGVPTVDDEEYAASIGASEQRRRLLTGLLVNDGWDLRDPG